jgi:hypothetical protein
MTKRAGRVTFLGDMLVAAGALGLLSRRKLERGDAAGNIPFGIGGAAVFFADARSAKPLLPKTVDYSAIGVCGLAAVGGLGYVLGLFVGWQLNGPMLIAAALSLAALGLQIARREN